MMKDTAIHSIESSYFLFSSGFGNLPSEAVISKSKPAVIGGLSKCKN